MKGEVLLLLPAALCPIHKDHVAILDAARATLRRRGHRVPRAFLLPSSEQYVGGKAGVGPLHPLVSLETRVELCRLATAELPWITVLDWGTASGNAARQRLQKSYDDSQTAVYIVAGGDTSRNRKTPHLVVVPRQDDSASSTAVRSAMASGDEGSIRNLVHPAVAERIITLVASSR
jgi:nicotinic acid mononucleotide adenylyltransferase